MRRVVGLDLNGWHDRVARTWSPFGDDDVDPTPQVIDGGVDPVVVFTGEHAELAVAGPQAALAPHGRGPGWGRGIGERERRLRVRDLLARLADGDDERAEVGLAAAVQAFGLGAERTILVVRDVPRTDDVVQERLLRGLRRGGARQPYLLWRPVALCLALIEAGTPTGDGQRVAVVSHTTDGLDVQQLTVRRVAESSVMAPERTAVGSACPWLGSLGKRLDHARRELGGRLGDLETAVIDTAHWPARAALGIPPTMEIVRRDNGSWRHLELPSRLPWSHHAVPEQVADLLHGAHMVVLETPASGEVADELQASLRAAIDVPMIVAPSEAAAIGARVAGERLARGFPVYLDFLPQIAVLVQGSDGPAFHSLVEVGATVPANQAFRSREPARFTWPAGQREVDVFLRKEGHERVRKAHVRVDEGPPDATTVTVTLEQRPAQGLARIEVRADDWDFLARHDFQLVWSEMEDEPRSESALIEAHRRPPPACPQRILLPTHPCAWNGTDGVEGLNAALEHAEPSHPSTLEPVLEILQRGVRNPKDGQWLRPLDSDGNPPPGIDASGLDALLEAASRWLFFTPTPTDNRLLLLLTWSFARCPEPVQDEMLAALAAQGHPWRQPKSADVVLWFGAGRTVTSAARVRAAFDLLLQGDPPLATQQQRACLAMLLTRRDASFEVLTPEDMKDLVGHAVRMLREAVDQRRVARLFSYALAIIGGLMRWRLRDAYALMPSADVGARALDEALERLITHSRSPLREQSKRRELQQTQTIAAVLRGEAHDQRLLVEMLADL